ncbi:MAG: Holliday junction branch migration protein RuvA [Epsilonproteobacteria bacterium]|jgi:Holliday junction DNA helicase RuvA|nr:Holliday junction branch migration protein RuvA [Campylobacterota bacterium]
MIAALRGEIFRKMPNAILLDVNGVIYEVIVSLNSYSQLKTNVMLYITEIIREDSYTLYGFVDEVEKKMFDTLIKINGIGAKVALAICSTFTPSSFASIVHTKNVSALKQVPGIGPKSANRILVELNDFDVASVDSTAVEIIAALENLGFKKDNITKVLKDITYTSTEDAIKQALKKLASL